MSFSRRAQLALKVDVDTLRGTREGVPRLVRLLRRHGADATFLFSVGPDHTGRALRRVLRPGFLSKVSRTSVIEHYGVRTLLYGTLLPGPHIGRSCGDALRAVRQEGFEVGLHAYDHVKWQDFVYRKDAGWTAHELQRGLNAFADVFGERPRVHGAAGWQMNDSAFALEFDNGLEYCSDTRGTHPFMPEIPSGSRACPQIPTTLPTLDELIGVNGASADDAATQLLASTRDADRAHVFTLHAELEGMQLLDSFSKLLQGWKAQGFELVSMRGIFENIDVSRLDTHEVTAATIPGRSGTVMTQGKLLSFARSRKAEPPLQTQTP
jgi:undecaprenyl phosphate-alpha-L-ara4FN deformylase